MTKNETISVITVVFNNIEGIETTIKSVLGQGYKYIQYIIIDGGSTDGTVDVIKKYEKKLFYWVTEPDKGIYDAMNKGISVATGSWMIFMNSGDRFANDSIIQSVFKVSYDEDILYGDAVIEYVYFQTLFRKHPLKSMWKKSPFCHQATFIKGTLMREWKYDLQYKIGGDHDFFFRAYTHGKKFRYLNMIICFFDGRAGTTKKFIIKATEEMFRSTLKHDFRFNRYLYSRAYLIYLQLFMFAKKIVGTRITTYLTFLVKGKKDLNV